MLKKYLVFMVLTFVILVVTTRFYDVKADGRIDRARMTIATSQRNNFVIMEDGTLWGWGFNQAGSLGDGTAIRRAYPVRIMDDVVYISAGHIHTAAIRTDGSLWAWGNNNSGEVGDGTTIARHSPTRIMDNVVSVSAGHFQTMAIQDDGSLWAWGFDFYHSPVKVMEGVIAVSAKGSGGAHIIRSDMSLWYVRGTQRGIVYEWIMDNVAAVSCHGNVSLIIRGGGNLYVRWHFDITFMDHNISRNRGEIEKVMDNVVAAVYGGIGAGLALRTDGSLWHWKSGDGSITNADNQPVQIMSNIIAVSARYPSIMALGENGVVRTWGNNFSNIDTLEGILIPQISPEATLPPPPAQHPPTPITARIPFQGRYFQLFDDGLTWDEAQQHAQSIGGNLATIPDQATQTFLESLVLQGNKNGYWIGGIRVADYGDNQFAWVTGEPMTFTNWSPGEPNNLNEVEDRLEFNRESGLWNDLPNNAGFWTAPEIPRLYAVGFIVEFLYNQYTPTEDINILSGNAFNDVVNPATLEIITDTITAVQAVQNALTAATPADLQSGHLELFAEQALSRAAQIQATNYIEISQATVTNAETIALQTMAAIEEMLHQNNYQLQRNLRPTISFITDYSDITIEIDPSTINTSIQQFTVQTPTAALTFSSTFVQQDVQHTPLTVTLTATNSYEVTFSYLPTYSVRLSLPCNQDSDYMAIQNLDTGQFVGGSRNPVTNKRDARITECGTFTVVENRQDFTDIQHLSQEAQQAIRRLAAQGMVEGVGGGQFAPDLDMTRAGIASIITGMINIYDPNADGDFVDVQRTDWYFGAAGSANRHGLMRGTGNNMFSPYMVLPRDQLTALSARVLRMQMGYLTPTNPNAALQRFADRDSFARWSIDDLALASQANLIILRADGMFLPSTSMTRGDAAVVLYRLYNRLW